MEVKLEKFKDKYKERRRKSAIYNFYSKEINKGKSAKAFMFDSISFRIILFIVILMVLSTIISNFFILLLLSIGIMYFINKFLKGIIARKNSKKIGLVKEDLKSKRLRRELTQLNREEFINYTKEILEKQYDTELSYGEDGIDLIGTINGKEYAIKCVKSTMEDKVLLKKIREFYDYIGDIGFEEGIMVTNGGFQKDEENSLPILLIDFLGIKKILQNIDEYPKDEEMDEYILQRHENNKTKARNDFKDITLGKILKLYFVFMIFYLLSYFVSYSVYYKIAGVMVFVIATVLAGIKLTEYFKLQDFTES